MSKNFTYPHGPLSWIASPNDFTGSNNLGIYAQETTQRYIYGTRYIMWDGRVFKYGNAVTALRSSFGAANYTSNATQNGAALPTAIVAGDRTVQITIANTNGYGGGAIAENELAGSYLEIQCTDCPAITRGIVGNDYVSTAGGVINVTLDFPVPQAYPTSGSWCDMILNPYRYLGNIEGSSNLGYQAWMGIPVDDITATYNCWIQTWGPCYVVAGGGDSTPGDTAGDRTVYFVGDGSINGGTAVTIESGFQKAGFIIDATATIAGGSAGGGVPIVMLQISI